MNHKIFEMSPSPTPHPPPTPPLPHTRQAHGAMGLSSSTPLPQFFSWARILRLADGPDEVHVSSLGKMELKPPRR